MATSSARTGTRRALVQTAAFAVGITFLLVGVLVAARHAAHSFSSGECEFLKQLSEHVALAHPAFQWTAERAGDWRERPADLEPLEPRARGGLDTGEWQKRVMYERNPISFFESLG